MINHRRLGIVALFIGVGVTAAGCSTGGSSPSKADIQSIFTIPVEMIQADVRLDESRKSEAVITPQGGVVSAIGSDGTQYLLEIPADALVSETTIGIIPAAGITGLPFGDGSAFAVQLEPDGLQLYAPAVLTITPSAEIPLDQQLLFDYLGQGADPILAAPVVDTEEIKIQVNHFSGYGVTKGFLADIETVRERLGGSAERRLQSRVAEELSRERQRQLLGADDEGEAVDLSDYFHEYEEQVVKPRLAAAKESCAAGRLALETVIGFERQRQLFGLEAEPSSTIDSGLMESVGETCMKEEYELCRDDHIVHRIIPAWLGLERQFQLFGVSDGETPNAVLESAKDYVRRCLSFELEFESESSTSQQSDGYTSTVKSQIAFQIDPDPFGLSSTEAPLVNTSFEMRMSGCSVNAIPGDGTFQIRGFSFVSDNHSSDDPLGYVRDITLDYFPGATSETYSISCDTFNMTFPESPLWYVVFASLHQDELDQNGGYLAENWEILGSELFAVKEWNREDGSLASSEFGSFKLYHRAK